MRVVKPSRVREYAALYPDAASSLLAWLRIAKRGRWRSIPEVRAQLPSADAAKVASGRIVTIFNIGGNKYRLIVSIHYPWSMLYVLRFVTHAEYDKNAWKETL